jgi:hypothetical protein
VGIARRGPKGRNIAVCVGPIIPFNPDSGQMQQNIQAGMSQVKQLAEQYAQENLQSL